MIPATSSAVPVADSQLIAHVAASGVGLGTSGGPLRTSRWRKGIFQVGLLIRFRSALNQPQTKTQMERTIHGIHARSASLVVGLGPVWSLAASPSKRHSFFGCQTFSST